MRSSRGSGVLARVRSVCGSNRGNGGAVDVALSLAGWLLSLRGLSGLDNGGGVGRDGEGGSLSDRVGLLLVSYNSRSGADESGLVDDL